MKYKSIMCLNELVFSGKHYQNGLICYKTNGLMVQNFNILSISILRHGNTGQNFLTRPDPTQKIPDPNPIFLTRSKNGLTRDPTRFYYGSTRPDPDNP